MRKKLALNELPIMLLSSEVLAVVIQWSLRRSPLKVRAENTKLIKE
ncbi:hypothetical protein ACFLYL_03700 [Chloroflexota bacterium]